MMGAKYVVLMQTFEICTFVTILTLFLFLPWGQSSKLGTPLSNPGISGLFGVNVSADKISKIVLKCRFDRLSNKKSLQCTVNILEFIKLDFFSIKIRISYTDYAMIFIFPKNTVCLF